MHVDPNSPGGKEYAIPLDQARDNATGGSSSKAGTQSPTGSGGSGTTSHLFGVGVGPSGGGSAGSGGGSGSHKGGSGHRSSNPGSGGSAADGRISALSVAAANPGGPQAPLLVVGGSAAVIFAGVLLGLMLRRRGGSGASA